ncbi:MAG: type II secretion system protein [Patescibacteria group bacterium]
MTHSIPPSSKTHIYERGFTLIEILVVIGMIAVLASVVLIAINPLRQFAQARNSQRISNVNAILNAVGNRLAEHQGIFTEASSTCPAIPSSDIDIAKNQYDLRRCLVPTYISELPFDPDGGSNTCINDACSDGDYDTRYTVREDSSSGRITVCAPNAGHESSIPDSQRYCLTR